MNGADVERVVRHAYAAYSHQDLPALLASVTEDADWPDGAVRLRGQDALRAFWTAQWRSTRTEDVPTRIHAVGPSVVAVHIDQTVRDLDGAVRARAAVLHVLQLAGRRIARLDIVPLLARDDLTQSDPTRERHA